jgi:GNAT superfamily N-acetyltransferase
MADWVIQPLADHHDRAGFVCGKPPLDDWILRYVGQYQRRDLTRAYVLVRPGEPRVHGYYAISNRHIDFAHLPPGQVKKLPHSLPLPAVLIGQLAVEQGVQGQGLGDVLLADALRRILALAERVGILAVIVDAIDEQARGFYLHRDFEPFQDDPSRLFLLIRDLRQAVLKPLVE